MDWENASAGTGFEKSLRQSELDRNLERAFFTLEYETAKSLIEDGAKPTTSMLSMSVAQRSTKFAILAMDGGVKPTEEMVALAMTKRDEDMANLLVSRNAPMPPPKKLDTFRGQGA